MHTTRPNHALQFGEHGQHPGVEVAEFLPVARSPPAVHELDVTIFGDLAVAAVGQPADLAGEELAAAGAFAAVLLGLTGNADGREFVAVAIHPAGQAQTQGAGVELV